MSDVVVCDDLAGLPAILQPQVQLLHWQRGLSPAIGSYVAGLAAAGQLGLGMRGQLSPGEQPHLVSWPPAAGRDAAAGDLALLADLFGTLLGCPQVGWRIEVLQQAMCPRFHVDRTGMRLVCTWQGAGTEWLAEADADRRYLGAASDGQPDADSGLMRGGKVGRSAAGDVLLLKGSLWQGNAGRGAIHRSPAVASKVPRVMLALDALWG
ncbi:DUF1826 domain-containing protein [Vogesella sp. XCS3]|uniref:DUF1826 domain-containing protein n=1 Tax=Vogesella sp. XCS3 TaxID=2877939 RepID=UPI001D0A75D6|nr:DUF1826 domain-containing protein [Vogesella sp. XCS3]UDM17576.1 DUF1826 domain-containing protein [Vogesella sp. XCS3]